MKFLKNTLAVMLSNISTIISGVLISFVLPWILSMEDYGYYKTFTLYVTYLGLFSLGIIDGIVLKYGGYDYDRLDKEKFRSYFSLYFLINLVFGIGLIITGSFLQNPESVFIIDMLAINMIVLNITGYYRQISEITQRFREYSKVKIVQSVLNILAVLILFGLNKLSVSVNYRIYTIIVVVCNVLISLWYVFTYREITFGNRTKLSTVIPEVINLSKLGIPLMCANLCSTLILTLDRQFVNLLFDNSTYAVYAFAYNLLSLFTVFTSAISTVLYPLLKRTDSERMKGNYVKLIPLSLAMIYLMLAVYFPMCAFIKWLLPKYVDALLIFRIIFPALAISSTITVVIHNYYKALKVNIVYFRRSIMILLLSAVANAIAYLLFKTTAAISAASVITIIIWYIYIEGFIAKQMESNQRKNIIYILLLTLDFYLTSAINSLLISTVGYILSYAVITFFVQKDIVYYIIRKIRPKRRI